MRGTAIELDNSAHQLTLARHDELLALAQQQAATRLSELLVKEVDVQSEEYSHSMDLIGRVGEAEVTIGLGSPEGRVLDGALRECFDSSVIEMLHTDREFRRKLEINRERRHLVTNGRIMAHDGVTDMLELCENGAESARQEAQTEERMLPVQARCEADERNARALLNLPVGSVRIGVSNYPAEAMARYGEKFYDDLGFRKGLAFLQWYYRVDERTLIAGSYSVDDSDVATMRGLWKEQGREIPEHIPTDSWLDYAVETSCSLEEARAKVLAMRERFYEMKGITLKRYSTDEFMALNKAAVDEMYTHLYRSLARAYHKQQKSPAMQALVNGLLHNTQGLNLKVRRQLQEINDGASLNKRQAALLEQLIRYATAERLRTGLQWLGTTERPVVRTLASTAGAGLPFLEHLARQSAASIMEGARAGRTYGGCTRSIDLAENPDATSSEAENPQEAFGGRGQDEGKESWKWKSGVCIVDNCPTRPRSTLVGPCSVCRKCQKCYDRGQDPSKVYAREFRGILAMADRVLRPVIVRPKAEGA